MMSFPEQGGHVTIQIQLADCSVNLHVICFVSIMLGLYMHT